MYEDKAAQLLTPDCRAWLEQGAGGIQLITFPHQKV